MQSSQTKPIFLVCGATGAQGGSVVRALMKYNKWHIRGITRDMNSEEARRLRDKGIEMMPCDMTKPEELKKAMMGVHTMYGMTNFWDPQEMNKEETIGRMMVDCAKQMGIKHFIWSWLPNVEKIAKGKYHVPHFTDKAKVGEYAMQQLPTTLVAPGFYYQNFRNMFTPKKESDGTLMYTLPQTSTLMAFDVDDIGEAVCCIANNRDEWIGKTVPLCGDCMPPQRYIDQMAEITGQKIKLTMMPREQYMKSGVEHAREIADMFGWFDEYGYFGPELSKNCCEMTKKICPSIKSWKQYLQTSKFSPK